MSDANKALKSKKNKSVLVLPFDKVHSLLKEVLHSNKLDDQVTLYLVAVLDYIAADILKVMYTLHTLFSAPKVIFLQAPEFIGK